MREQLNSELKSIINKIWQQQKSKTHNCSNKDRDIVVRREESEWHIDMK